MTSAAISRWILAVVLIAGIAVAWWVRRRPPQYALAYIGDRAVTVWSTTAQVRRTVGTLGYGDKVSVIRESGDQTEIRTAGGIRGWVDAHLLMSPEMWRKLGELAAGARQMPVQAVGHTRALSNVHVEPNRDAPRIFQFGANVPLLVLDRRSVRLGGPFGRPSADNSAPHSELDGGKTQEEASPEGAQRPKEEDWLLVLRTPPQGQKAVAAIATFSSGDQTEPGSPARPPADIPIAGWILARFVELDPPPPIPDYASAAGMHVVAWVVLNSVPDAGGEKPQYLVAGTRGSETPGCDFTSFRVFTWGAQRQRYETAYVSSNVCGHLPILVQPASAGPEFHFRDPEAQPGQEDSQRFYQMRQTIVRPVKQGETGELPREPRQPRKPREHRSTARGKRL